MGNQGSAGIPPNQAVMRQQSAPPTAMLPDSLKAMMPQGLEAAVNGVFQSNDSVPVNPQQGQMHRPRPQQNAMRPPQPMAARGDSFAMGMTDGPQPCKGKGRGEGKGKDEPFMNLRDLQGKGKGLSKGSGKGKAGGGSYDSFMTNAPMCGSFATGAPDTMSFQTDVLGTRNSFAARRSDESFACSLPPSAARSGQTQLPVCVSFVGTPSEKGINTQPPQGRNTQMPTQDSFYTQVPTQDSFCAQTTLPTPKGHSTQPPMNMQKNCPSFMAMRSGPAGRHGPGMGVIYEDRS